MTTKEKTMTFQTALFGPVDADEASAICFPAGLPGFETCRRFTILPHPKQPALITAAIARMPPGSEIVRAMDCDQAGHLAQIIGNACRQPGCRDVSYRVHLPPREDDDWNDVLKDRNALSFPAGPTQGPALPKPPGF